MVQREAMMTMTATIIKERKKERKKSQQIQENASQKEKYVFRNVNTPINNNKVKQIPQLAQNCRWRGGVIFSVSSQRDITQIVAQTLPCSAAHCISIAYTCFRTSFEWLEVTRQSQRNGTRQLFSNFTRRTSFSVSHVWQLLRVC
jgi:hypothetical protein